MAHYVKTATQGQYFLVSGRMPPGLQGQTMTTRGSYRSRLNYVVPHSSMVRDATSAAGSGHYSAKGYQRLHEASLTVLMSIFPPHTAIPAINSRPSGRFIAQIHLRTNPNNYSKLLDHERLPPKIPHVAKLQVAEPRPKGWHEKKHGTGTSLYGVPLH